MEVFLIWIVLSFIIGLIGNDRKIGFAGAFFISLLLSPLIGFIVTLTSKHLSDIRREQAIMKSLGERNVSTADELVKLEHIRSTNIISEEEYQNQRAKLLGYTYTPPKKKSEFVSIYQSILDIFK